jgi:4'-phosphopantetheinyl transferase EntD
VIAEILPPAAVVVEARDDPPDALLFPAEQAALGQAVDKRRREFTTARHCARQALAQLGVPPLPILNGPRGEPRWPAGIVGSITHCAGYRACAVARDADLIALGIDAEPHMPLPNGVLATVAGIHEQRHLRELQRTVPHVHWDRLLFSAKESIYKTWFPLTRRPLDFKDAELTILSPGNAFTARLLVPAPAPHGELLRALTGRWLVCDGLVLTAIALPAVV